MSSWLHRQASSHQGQIVGTALLSGLAVAGTILGVQAIRRRVAMEDLKASIPNVDEEHPAETLPDYNYVISSTRSAFNKEDERIAQLAQRAQKGDYDEELIQEQLTRTSTFLTPAGLSTLRSSFIVIIGLGGVGSHCAAALTRSGVSHIRLIDFDQVTLSSLNRHSVATLADVGTPKVTCVRKRLEAVAPWVQWECFNEVWRENEAKRTLGPWDGGKGQRPDYVVDAIDNIDSKVALLKYCHSNSIRVISSMGAGCKSDPTRIFVGDIKGSVEDPLSRTTRRRLRALGVNEGIPVVYSIEKPGPGKANLLPLPEEEYQKGNVNELSVLPDFRARILPVLGTMPAVFGQTIANYIILEISNYPHKICGGGGKGRDKYYDNILNNLQICEEKLVQHAGEDPIGLKIPVTKDDVGYLIEEVFRGKSVVSGLSTRLALVRWRSLPLPQVEGEGKRGGGYLSNTSIPNQKSSRVQLNELVCMTKEEAARHLELVLKTGKNPEEAYDESVIELVNRRRKEEEVYSRYR